QKTFPPAPPTNLVVCRSALCFHARLRPIASHNRRHRRARARPERCGCAQRDGHGEEPSDRLGENRDDRWRRQLSHHPLAARSLHRQDFATLSPGVVRDPRGGDLSVGGQRGTLNSLQVDGVDNNNTFFGQALGRGGVRPPYQFSEESVQEFQVNQNGFSAEFGRAGGAVINVVTKSGTNAFHGGLFEFFRDEALNANDPITKANEARRGQANVRPPLRINQSNNLSLRYNHQGFTGVNNENNGPLSAEEHSGDSLVKSDTFSGTLASTLTRSVVNELRFQFARDKEPGEANSADPEAVINTGAGNLNIGRNNFSPRETTIKR